MADKQAVGDNPLSSIGASSRQRFSLISLFASNQSSSRSSFKEKRQKSGKKSKSKAATDSHTTTAASAPTEATIAAPTPPSTTTQDSLIGLTVKPCPLCFDDLPITAYPTLTLTCGHRSCGNCLQEYLKIEIGESRVDISCPECKERLHPADIHKLLKDNTTCRNKYEEFMVRRVLVTDPDTRWCPAPDCGYAVIAAGCASCPMLKCQRPGCNTQFCYHCKQEWHANQTCDAARLERFPIMRLSLSDVRNLARTADQYKSCPRCKTMINKMDDGSCNHMTCSICGAQFCWLCLKEASDLHYLSPSGCTFWGKKPWSKKKKILWQLGTLIGAPVGIALIAGLSVPVLIFGLPIWAARKLHQRCKNYNKHKRNAIITFGTIGAFIASPIVAGITIAIGVPVMLAYVYGVVPYSLCRGGTCGVKNDGGTFSFDFGSSNEESAGQGNNGAFLVANPSIGPGSIGESSLAAGFALSASGVQMDRVGLPDDQSDTKSASMKNMVGTSITGSIDDPEGQKMEIRADVSLRPTAAVERKNSIDSQTLSQADNRSVRSLGLSDNRSHVSFNVDNASMKALAGSICAQRERDVAFPQELAASDVRNKSCMKGEHGSPISNRSVSFAAHDKKTKSKTKNSSKRRKDLEKADKLSIRSLDTLSNYSSASGDIVPIGKRCTEYRPRTSEMHQRGVSEIAQRGVSEIIHRGSTDCSSFMDSSVGTAQLTVVEVDQSPALSAAPIQTAVAVGGGEGVHCTDCSQEKALCNIQEDHGHI